LPRYAISPQVHGEPLEFRGGLNPAAPLLERGPQIVVRLIILGVEVLLDAPLELFQDLLELALLVLVLRFTPVDPHPGVAGRGLLEDHRAQVYEARIAPGRSSDQGWRRSRWRSVSSSGLNGGRGDRRTGRRGLLLRGLGLDLGL